MALPVTAFEWEKVLGKIVGTISHKDLLTLMNENPFKGKCFCFTGSLGVYSRKDASDIINKNGGVVNNAISRNVDYLVATITSSTKANAARKLGIKIVSEERFMSFVNRTEKITKSTGFEKFAHKVFGLNVIASDDENIIRYDIATQGSRWILEPSALSKNAFPSCKDTLISVENVPSHLSRELK